VRLTLLCLVAGTLAAQPVQVSQGQLEGSKSADGKIRIYQGVPYAAPPIGDLR
jgi:para-nitrobenzyl esterase